MNTPFHFTKSYVSLWVLTQETEVSSNDTLSFEGQAPSEAYSEVEINMQKFYRGVLSDQHLLGK